jgi:23S rRNA pseudouridine1911/1915/1917 synthase
MASADTLDVLYEDNHCLGLNKPAGRPTTHFDGSEETVDRLAKGYLKAKHGKPGNVFLGVVHRLDKPVSGALLFARTSKAAARLSEQFRDGSVEKVYWAVIEDASKPRDGYPWALRDDELLEDWLLHDDAEQRVRVVAPDTPGAKPAKLRFQTLARHGGLALLELRPHTGRKHQLRVQLASRGRPILGDAKYGSPHALGLAIALHARSLRFLHPTRHETVTLLADVPAAWQRFAPLLHGISG